MRPTQTPEPATCDTAPGLIPLEQAVALALEQVTPTGHTDQVALGGAVDRIAAESVVAPAAMPFFDNSAMDGFALCHADLAAVDTLPISGTAPAGSAPGTLAPATAMRIYTGAPLPAGADTVVMLEHCADLGDAVRIVRRPDPGANIRRAGSE